MILWDLGLTLFDIPKDVVFAEILILSNIFVFFGGKLGPKMEQNCLIELTHPTFTVLLHFGAQLEFHLSQNSKF